MAVAKSAYARLCGAVHAAMNMLVWLSHLVGAALRCDHAGIILKTVEGQTQLGVWQQAHHALSSSTLAVLR